MTVVPLTVQTLAGDAVNVTARLDDAVAFTVKGDWAIFRLASDPKVIVWFAFDTVNDQATVAAGL